MVAKFSKAKEQARVADQNFIANLLSRNNPNRRNSETNSEIDYSDSSQNAAAQISEEELVYKYGGSLIRTMSIE